MPHLQVTQNSGFVEPPESIREDSRPCEETTGSAIDLFFFEACAELPWHPRVRNLSLVSSLNGWALERRKRITRNHSGRINEDDGVDPGYYFAPDRRSQTNHRKAWQLCRQVSDTLSYVLHGDGSSELLNSLQVVQVRPAPDTARLLVLVQSDLPIEQVRPNEIVALLASQEGRLRTEVARSINRKKTPRLTFQLVHAHDLGSAQEK